MRNTVEGKSGIKATVICDSISEEGIRLTTFELEYPRLIHSEFMTHSMIARNAASSRAIPFNKMKEQLTASPVRFGSNQSGMQDAGEHTQSVILAVEVDYDDPTDSGLFHYELAGMTPKDAWEEAKTSAVMFAEAFYQAGYHKQVVNRLTEPFQMIKTVATATEWANYFWLRNHQDADPTIAELARCQWEALKESTPQLLKAGEWHLPYVETSNFIDGKGYYLPAKEIGEDVTVLTLEDAKKVSAARTAAISFRNEDYGLQKCLEVYNRLVGADRKHASAFGHQATPMKKSVYESFIIERSLNLPSLPATWEQGISHADRRGQLWSAMFRGFIQYRKLIPGENYTG